MSKNNIAQQYNSMVASIQNLNLKNNEYWNFSR